MSKSLLWDCTIKSNGPKTTTGPTTPQGQQDLATLDGQAWATLSTSGCPGSMRESPCQPLAEIEPSRSIP